MSFGGKLFAMKFVTQRGPDTRRAFSSGMHVAADHLYWLTAALSLAGPIGLREFSPAGQSRR